MDDQEEESKDEASLLTLPGDDEESSYHHDWPTWRRWAVVASGFWVNFTALLLLFVFGVFMEPMSVEFQLSQSTTTWVQSLCAFMLLFFSPAGSYLSDRLSQRSTCAIGAVLGLLGVLSGSFAPSIGVVVLLYGGLGGLGASLAYVVACVAPVEVFPQRKGVASAVAMAGSAVGGLALVPVMSAAVTALGWRSAMRILAAIYGGITLLAALAFSGTVKQQQQQQGWQLAAWARSVAPLVATRRFLFICLAWFFANFSYLFPYTYIIAMADQQGVEHGDWLLTSMSVADLLCRLPLTWLADRYGHTRVSTAYTLAIAAVCLVFAFVARFDSFWQLLLPSLLYGAFVGAWMALGVPVISQWFGYTDLVGLSGLLNSSAALGALLGPPLLGSIQQALGSFFVPALVAAALYLCGALFYCLLERLPAPSGQQPVSVELSP